MWAKLEALAAGARLASKELWRRSAKKPAAKSIPKRSARRRAAG
jgi:5-methyltetrahydropteroyltriglutamate--homocysteine methyltransferase